MVGSVSVGNGVYLWLIAKYFSPKTVLEIGTYIGRSALALLFGGRLSISELYTCDGSYDCLNFSDYKNDMFEGDDSHMQDSLCYLFDIISRLPRGRAGSGRVRSKLLRLRPPARGCRGARQGAGEK